MRALLVVALLAPAVARAKAVESFNVIMGNETKVADGSEVQYFENTLWLQKSWEAISRDKHTAYVGSLLELTPTTHERTRAQRYGFETIALMVGYKLRTYVPDWYNFNLRLLVPLATPSDPFGRPPCRAAQPEDGSCAEARAYSEGFELQIDPLLISKTWNLFTVWDRNRVTFTVDTVEYRNKLRLIDVTPDLEFPIAMYVGDEVRLRRSFAGGWRVRNDLMLGLASNVFDWAHIGVEVMFHSDTNADLDGTFQAQLYVELFFEIFFDNTFGAVEKREVHREERD